MDRPALNSLSHCPVCAAPLRAVEWAGHTIACMRIEARTAGLRPTVADVSDSARVEPVAETKRPWPFG